MLFPPRESTRKVQVSCARTPQGVLEHGEGTYIAAAFARIDDVILVHWGLGKGHCPWRPHHVEATGSENGDTFDGERLARDERCATEGRGFYRTAKRRSRWALQGGTMDGGRKTENE